MKKMLIDASHEGELRVALIDQKRKLIDLHIERTSQQKKQSNIYKGKITSIEESLGAIFINYGENQRHGFLPFKEISQEYFLAEPKYKQQLTTQARKSEVSQRDDGKPCAENNATSNKDSQPDAIDITQDGTINENEAQQPITTNSKQIKTTENKSNEPFTADKDPAKIADNSQQIATNTTQASDSESATKDNTDKANNRYATAKKNSPSIRRTNNQAPINLKEILKVGQELVVQVEKDERGNKGAALTTYISLAGAYLVLMPNNSRAGGVSRRIAGNDRESLRDTIKQLNLPDSMGVIIRTAGVNQALEALQWDLEILMQYWEAVKQAAVAKAGPYLIHQESDVVIRSIRDHLKQDVGEIIVNEKDSYERAHQYLCSVRPEFSEQLKLHDGNLPLFTEYQIEKQIELAHKREIRLPSGGSIVIDHTEALISIDINSSRSTKGKGIEETAYHTNLEAATEIARQLRIRDIGGLIVIDFIDMNNNKHQKEVENRLRDAVKMDRARIQIGRISQRFGLLEMSRQRVGQSLRMTSHTKCPRCSGVGIIRTIESQTFALLHLIQEQAAKHAHQHFQLQLPVDVATYLINEKRAELSRIELNQQCHITVIPNPNLTSPNYTLKQNRINPDNSKRRLQASYKLLQIPRIKNKPLPSLTETKAEVPAVNPKIPTRHYPQKKNNEPGVFQKLWDKMRGIEQTPGKANISKKNSTQQRQPSGQPSNRRPNNTRSHQNKTNSRQQKRNTQNNQQRRQSAQNNQQRQLSLPNNPQRAQQDKNRRGTRANNQGNHRFQQPNPDDLTSQQLQNTINRLQEKPNNHMENNLEQMNTLSNHNVSLNNEKKEKKRNINKEIKIHKPGTNNQKIKQDVQHNKDSSQTVQAPSTATASAINKKTVKKPAKQSSGIKADTQKKADNATNKKTAQRLAPKPSLPDNQPINTAPPKNPKPKSAPTKNMKTPKPAQPLAAKNQPNLPNEINLKMPKSAASDKVVKNKDD